MCVEENNHYLQTKRTNRRVEFRRPQAMIGAVRSLRQAVIAVLNIHRFSRGDESGHEIENTQRQVSFYTQVSSRNNFSAVLTGSEAAHRQRPGTCQRTDQATCGMLTSDVGQLATHRSRNR